MQHYLVLHKRGLFFVRIRLVIVAGDSRAGRACDDDVSARTRYRAGYKHLIFRGFDSERLPREGGNARVRPIALSAPRGAGIPPSLLPAASLEPRVPEPPRTAAEAPSFYPKIIPLELAQILAPR